MKPVAFIGLDQMGRLMSANLVRAGLPVRTYDLNGRGNCRSAAEAVRGAGVVLTMLPDGRAVRRFARSALPGLAPGSVLVDMSSSDPADTAALARLLGPRGVALVDAPVSGASLGARQGTLTLMMGGEAKDVARVRPVLRHLGSRLFHMGPLGSGHAMKALNNYIAAAGTIAAFEAAVAGQRLGLDLRRMVEVLNASTGYNTTTQRKIPQQVLTGAFASGFSTALMAKDVAIAARITRRSGWRAPYLAATSRLWQAARRQLPEGSDHTEMYRFLERASAPSRAAGARRKASRRPPRRST